MKDFQDKLVVVTGAGSGIGRATANLFARLGADVVFGEKRVERIGEVEEEIGKAGGRARGFPLDVAVEQEMEDFARKVIAEKGRVDILVNNAGVSFAGEIKDIPLPDFHWVMNVVFFGVVHGVHFFLPHMIKARSGHIVNVGSLNSIASFPFNGPYNAGKSAVLAYSETLRAETAHLGIRVTVICPGLIRTNIANDSKHNIPNPKTQRYIEGFRRHMARAGTDPMAVAERIVRAIRRNEAVVLYPADSRRIGFVARHLPGLYRRVIRREYQKRV